MKRPSPYLRTMITATLAAVFTLIMIILAIVLMSPAEAETMYCICTPEGQVNIRSRATTHGDIIGHLYCGDAVEITGQTKSGSGTWYRINAPIEAGSGWVSSAYLVSSPPVYQDQTATVEASGRVALRKSPGGARSAWLSPGDEVRILAMAGDWALTDRGYVMAKYLAIR